MKRYKLLKDLPYARAGEVFERNTHKNKDGLSDYDYLEIKKRVKVGEDEVRFGIKYNHFLDNFDEWFEEIQGPTDSIHWKPVIGEEYWSFHSDGGISHNFCTGCYWDTARYKMGRTYRTKEECIRARNRELAEARLRRTSTFEPDWEDGLQIKYVVIFNHVMNRLEVHELTFEDLGLPVYFESEVSAMKSIRENEQDWKIYFGIEEEE